MSGDILDSNVILYLFDETDERRRRTAERLVTASMASGRGSISYQVVQETLNVLTVKLAVVVPPEKEHRIVSIKQVIETLNRMEAEGIIERYAIGGAVGATFYLEPVATLDVDVFVAFGGGSGSLLISPEPIFRYLRSQGGRVEGEYVHIAGWPVQFLPPTGPLVEEALEQAVTVDVQGMPARVFTAEHLAAIALQTGRAKDKARLLQFIESGVLQADRFQAILAHHGLADAWHRFAQQFLADEP
jgi:hypothetical protein